MGQVIKTVPGTDGLVRTVVVKTGTSTTLVRPIQKLCLLEESRNLQRHQRQTSIGTVTLILIDIPLLLEVSRCGNPCLVCVFNASPSSHEVGCSGWVPCFVSFPAFRGHVTLFLAYLLIHLSECLQLGHSLEITIKLDRSQRIDDCIVWNIVFAYCHDSRLQPSLQYWK